MNKVLKIFLKIFIIFPVVYILTGLTMEMIGFRFPNWNSGRPVIGSGIKGCFADQRVLFSAIEMYNMDENYKITSIEHGEIEELKDKKYLKGWPPEYISLESRKKCKYTSFGDLSDNGYVYCEYHGTIDSRKEPSREYFNDENSKENRRNMPYYINFIAAVVITCLL